MREDAVTYPCDAPDKPGNEIIFAQSFPTKSGRAKIVPADLLPPDELPDEAYPMVLTTGRLLEHWHTGSMTRRASNLDALEPEAIAGLNPREMDKLGVPPGGFIRVSTRRGEVTLEGARRPRRGGGHGVHPVLLRGGRRQPAHQPAARPDGQDPGVQVLRGQGGAGGDGGGGGVGCAQSLERRADGALSIRSRSGPALASTINPSERLPVLSNPLNELAYAGLDADLGLPAKSGLQLANVADVDLLVAGAPIVPAQTDLAAEARLEHLDQIEQETTLSGPPPTLKACWATLSGARMAAS